MESFAVSQHPATHRTPSAVLLGKKRAWIPDEKEAYIEIEIKELSGDKVIVETKDGKVSDRPFTCSHERKPLNTVQRFLSHACLPPSL